jgi:hypothetical protein
VCTLPQESADDRALLSSPQLDSENDCAMQREKRTWQVRRMTLHANDAIREAKVAQFKIDRTHPGRWTITFNNAPINMFLPTTIDELASLMTEIETDPSVKVVVFQSVNPDFFIAHLDVAKAAERPDALGLWRKIVLRLSSNPVVSIAKIRGRTRGIGNEFVLACDMRFASRQKRLVRQPRGWRRTGPGRRRLGMAPAPGRPLART